MVVAVAAAPAAATGFAVGTNILRQLAFQAGLTGLSAAAMDPNAGKKLGKVGGFLQDAGGNLARDLLDTQPRSGRQNNAPKTTERPYGSTATLNGKPVVWAGKDYGWQSPITGSSTLSSLNSPGVQNRFIQDTGSSSSPAAERAYQAERSSVAQQAKQNPSLPISYSDQAELARQSLQGYNPASGPLPGAAQTAQDMGMAIWAKKYGPGSKNDLASKVRPGQSGFGAIQNTLAASAANTGFQLPTQLSFTPPPSVTPTPFPMEALQSGFQVPGAPITDLLSNYPGFDPNEVDIGLFSKFMQANPKK